MGEMKMAEKLNLYGAVDCLRNAIKSYEEKIEQLNAIGISLTIFDEDVLENMRDCIIHILPNAGVFIEEHVEIFSTDELLEIEELAKKGLVESVSYFGGKAEVNLVTGGIIEIMGDETDED